MLNGFQCIFSSYWISGHALHLQHPWTARHWSGCFFESGMYDFIIFYTVQIIFIQKIIYQHAIRITNQIEIDTDFSYGRRMWAICKYQVLHINKDKLLLYVTIQFSESVENWKKTKRPFIAKKKKNSHITQFQ